jgi:hypothetical protein
MKTEQSDLERLIERLPKAALFEAIAFVSEIPTSEEVQRSEPQAPSEALEASQAADHQ